MTTTEATAEVFWTAYSALKKRERVAVAQRLLQNADMREDLRHAMIVEDRKKEPTVSLDDYLSQRAGITRARNIGAQKMVPVPIFPRMLLTRILVSVVGRITGE